MFISVFPPHSMIGFKGHTCLTPSDASEYFLRGEKGGFVGTANLSYPIIIKWWSLC